MVNTFFENFCDNIAATEVATKDGLSYLSAATAVMRAHRPEFQFVDFDGKPYLTMLGGAVVAVDIATSATPVQRMWLPVMDAQNYAVPFASMTVTDINSARQRALVKAIACSYGVGMSLYMGYDGDGLQASQALGVTPDSYLAQVTPVVAVLRKSKARYVEWGVAIAAAKITDPAFHWNVVLWDGLPYRKVLGGLVVDVETTYRDKTLCMSLPVLDAAFKPISEQKATVMDWNKTVMRALTKCLAFNAGYGLSVYAGEEFDDVKETKPTRVEKKEPTVAATPSEPSPTLVGQTFPPLPTDTLPAEPTQEPTVTVVTVDTVVEKSLMPAEAAEVPTVEATATTQDTSGPKEKKATDTESVDTSDTANRFSGVMRKRYDDKGVPGLVGLFDAIKVSTKFSDEEKPTCYRLLTSGIASAFKSPLSAEDLADLFDNIRKHSAIEYLAQDNRDIVCAKLVRRSIESVLDDTDDQVLANVIMSLMDAGIASDKDDLARLALLANTPVETVDFVMSLV